MKTEAEVLKRWENVELLKWACELAEGFGYSENYNYSGPEKQMILTPRGPCVRIGDIFRFGEYFDVRVLLIRRAFDGWVTNNDCDYDFRNIIISVYDDRRDVEYSLKYSDYQADNLTAIELSMADFLADRFEEETKNV